MEQYSLSSVISNEFYANLTPIAVLRGNEKLYIGTSDAARQIRLRL